MFLEVSLAEIRLTARLEAPTLRRIVGGGGSLILMRMVNGVWCVVDRHNN